MIKKLINAYSEFVTRHPFIILVLSLLLTVFFIYMAGTITTKTTESRDFLPKDVEAMNTLFTVEDEFGSTNAIYLVVEVDPEYSGSNEIRDVRDPEVLRYMDNIAELARHTEGVIDATGPASVLKSINGGRIPQSQREVAAFADKNGLLDEYISRDYTMARVSLRTTDDVNLDDLEIELEKIINQVPKPPGIFTSLGGPILEQQVIKKAIGPDMAKTSMYSLIGILAIILLLFRSVKYGFTPLATIIFGSVWAMGYVGLIGMGLSSATSGVLSMIMGIGIDFGIQLITRYRFELPGKSPGEAMAISLNNVIIPMTTTTLAALIGFQAMQLGKLSFLKDMGIIMSYGVAASMFAAITIVPAIMLIIDTTNVTNIANIKNMYKKLIDRSR